jgi:hypothetical protein
MVGFTAARNQQIIERSTDVSLFDAEEDKRFGN